MGKYIFLAIVFIVIAVAIVNVVTQLKGSMKFESLSSLLKLNYQAPSAANSGTPSVSVGTGTTKNGGTTSGGSSSPSHSVAPTPAKPTVTPPPGFTAADLSPYYGNVRITSLYTYVWYNSHLSLSAYGSASPIDVSGWTVKSNEGSMQIPQAVNDYNPSGLSPSTDIMLPSGGRLDIYNTASPIAKNLRINKCMGYLNNTYAFSPQLQCSYIPLYNRSDISTLSGNCQSYILSLGSCRSPSASSLNSFSNEPACVQFLNRFNYASCYNINVNTDGFLTNQWIAWIPGMWSFDSKHDRVLLLDRNGLLVSEYTY